MTNIDELQAIERARRIIAALGGVAEVCRITGKSRTRVYNWMYERSRKGTGGMIPPDCQIVIVEHARREGLPVTPADFFPASSEAAA